jgi:hypothetical protein
MNPSNPLQTEESGNGNDIYYAASAVSPNANHQVQIVPLFIVDRIAEPEPNAAQTLQDQQFEDPESQELFLQCLTPVWHRDIRVFARQLEEYSNEAHLSTLKSAIHILRLFFKANMIFPLTVNPQMTKMSYHVFRTPQRLPSSQKIFLEPFLTVRLSTGCHKCATTLNFVFVHVQFHPNHGGKKLHPY